MQSAVSCPWTDESSRGPWRGGGGGGNEEKDSAKKQREKERERERKKKEKGKMRKRGAGKRFFIALNVRSINFCNLTL